MVSKIFAHKKIRNKISIRYLHYNGQLEGRQQHTFHSCRKIWITQQQIGLNINYWTFIEFQPTVSLIISSGGGFPGLDGETPHLSYSTFHILTSGGFPHFSGETPRGVSRGVSSRTNSMVHTVSQVLNGNEKKKSMMQTVI